MRASLFRKKINYYLGASYRRFSLDRLQGDNQHLYRGIVLDIGGRDRGNFEKPRSKVEKWIFADINQKNDPDIVLDVSDMRAVQNDSVDVISAIELFEHVLDVEKGLSECYRVLKNDGTFIMSVPFLFRIHADPHDYQRWTLTKWEFELKRVGFKFEKVHIQGFYFTVLADMAKVLIKSLPYGIRHVFCVMLPLLDLLPSLDGCNFVKRNETLNKYHGGYFFVLKKIKPG